MRKRNVKFKSAINAYLNKCAEEKIDAVELITNESQHYIPQPKESREATPAPLPVSKKIPQERDTVSAIIQQITEQEWYTGQIVPDGHRVFDAQPSIFGDLNFPLSQNLVNALYNSKGITQLYSHQVEAINHLQDGHNVIVSTSTSSGKSLIYQIPMLHALESDPEARGMYIFPTKALAQDQRRSMKEMLSYLPNLEQTLVDTF